MRAAHRRAALAALRRVEAAIAAGAPARSAIASESARPDLAARAVARLLRTGITEGSDPVTLIARLRQRMNRKE